MHYFVYQGNDYDCGFACLKMLLCHAHKTSHFLSLQKPVDKRGLYSYKDLIAIARSEGVILCAYTVDDKKEILAYRKRPLLVALYTKMGNLHLVLLKKIGHQKVFIDDPQIGPRIIDRDTFLKLWDGTYIEIVRVERKRKPRAAIELLPNKNRLLLIASQICSSIFVLLGFAFVSADSYFVYPLIFFSLFIICELLFQRFNLSVLEKFDERYLPATYDQNKETMRVSYVTYHEFKKRYFLWPQILITSLLVVVLSCIILLINSHQHLLFLLLIGAFALFSNIFVERKAHIRREEIERREQELFQDNGDKSDTISKLAMLSKTSHKEAKRIVSHKSVGIFFIATCALVFAAINNQANLNFFLFHFFAYVLVYENLSKVLRCILERNELAKMKERFIDRFVQ